jgi:hypothetical protein
MRPFSHVQSRDNGPPVDLVDPRQSAVRSCTPCHSPARAVSLSSPRPHEKVSLLALRVPVSSSVYALVLPAYTDINGGLHTPNQRCML